MRFQIERFKGRIRMARGRCPACDSAGAVSCGVCRDHTGPFPVGSDTQRRWWFRYETMLLEARQEWSSASLAPVLALRHHRRSA